MNFPAVLFTPRGQSVAPGPMWLSRNAKHAVHAAENEPSGRAESPNGLLERLIVFEHLANHLIYRWAFSQFNFCAELHHLGSGNQEVVRCSYRITRHESVEAFLPDRNVRPE